MTEDEKRKLMGFFDAVIRVVTSHIVTKRIGLFHDPSPSCFNGSCIRPGIGFEGAYTRKCNWNDLLELSKWFLKHGPEVDEIWKREARNGRFNPEEIHDIMLGVLVGGDGDKKGAIDLYSHNVFIDGVRVEPKDVFRLDTMKSIRGEPKQ